MKAKKAFDKVYGDSKNFITNHIIEYGETEDYYYELAHSGEPFMGRMIVGVTVLEKKDLDRKSDLSTSFSQATDKYNDMYNSIEKQDKAVEAATEKAREYIKNKLGDE